MTREQEDKLNEIHTALVGDTYRDGLVTRLNRVEEEQIKNKKFRWVFGTGILATISTIITKLIN